MTSKFSRDLTAEEVHDLVAWLKSVARDGAKAVHARATVTDTRSQLTPTEELARARARADKEARR
jgi:hypothetical protein